jgi:hypothetical protein
MDDEIFSDASEIDTQVSMMDLLSEFLNACDGVRNVETFENEGLLTHDDGLVVRLSNGAKFHITIERVW